MIDPTYDAIMLSRDLKILLHYEVLNSELYLNILKAYISQEIENLSVCNFNETEYILNLKVKKQKNDSAFYYVEKFGSIYYKFLTDSNVKNTILNNAKRSPNAENLIRMYNWIESGDPRYIMLMYNVLVLPDKTINIFL